MIIQPKFQPVTVMQSQDQWKVALQDARRSGICGLMLSTTGPDPLSHEIRQAFLALPDGCVYAADCLALGSAIVRGLAGLKERQASEIMNFLLTLMHGRRFRRFTIERVIEDIRDAEEHCTGSIFFPDDNITLDPKRLERIRQAGSCATARYRCGLLLFDSIGWSGLHK